MPSVTVLFSFNDTAPTEIYTLSLHDALPIFSGRMKSLYLGASFAPRIEHAASQIQDSSVLSDFAIGGRRSEEHTSELQSHSDLVCRLLLEKKKELGNVPDSPRALTYGRRCSL